METNCDVNHLESDVLLPPRKRLLAGFKRQNSDGNGSSPPAVASSSNASSTSSDVDTHHNNLLASRLNDPNLTPEEIAEASRSAAIAAVKAAKAARAAADEKAAIAAKAVAAAKSALDLVASFDEEPASKERYLKKNKLKKHVPVELLYTKDQPRENNRTDEELARRLHRAINSSPRILRTCSSSELKGHKLKKHKGLASSETSRFSNGDIVLREGPHYMSNGHAIAGEVDFDSSSDRVDKKKADEKSPLGQSDEKSPLGQSDLDNMEAESSHSKERNGNGVNSSGKKRGRVKLKKLPLSIFNSRDQVNSKEEGVARSSPSHLAEKGKASMPSFQPEPSNDVVIPLAAATTWKCQDFKAPECVKQNKVVHS